MPKCFSRSRFAFSAICSRNGCAAGESKAANSCTVQAVLRRTYAFGQNNSLLERGGVVLNPGNGTISVDGKLADLTKNVLKILQILFEHQGHVVSRESIMTKLWESDSFVDDNTLTVNITRIRRKLEGLGVENFIITKKGLGYMV